MLFRGEVKRWWSGEGRRENENEPLDGRLRWQRRGRQRKSHTSMDSFTGARAAVTGCLRPGCGLKDGYGDEDEWDE